MNANVSTSIPQYLVDEIDTMARRSGISRAEILRRCIDAGYDRVAYEIYQDLGD